MTVLRLGNGSTFQTVRVYLGVVERNVYSLVAAGAVVQPQTQLLLEILRERGDEMDVDRMKSFILRLGNELNAAQQVAGITSEDFQRIEAECATNAGRAAVERRVEAAEKVMFQAMQPVDVRPIAQQRSGDANGRSVGGDVVADAAAGDHVADVGSRREIATLGCGDGGGGGVVTDHPKSSESTGVVTNPVRLNKRLRKKRRREAC